MSVARRRLLLMRHGQVAYFDDAGRPLPPDGVTLTVAGRAQADAVGTLLATSGLRPERIVTSSLARTRETATRVLEAAGLDDPGTQVEPALDEIRGGRLADLADDALEAAFTDVFDRPPDGDPAGPDGWRARRFLGGESVGALLSRVEPAVARLLADPDWDVALWVLHGGVNRVILSGFMAGPGSFVGGLAQDAGCINAIDVAPTGANSVVRVVNHCPLDPLQRGSRATTMEELLALYRRYRPARSDATGHPSHPETP